LYRQNAYRISKMANSEKMEFAVDLKIGFFSLKLRPPRPTFQAKKIT